MSLLMFLKSIEHQHFTIKLRHKTAEPSKPDNNLNYICKLGAGVS
jgi:hypothetical protein